MSLISLFSNSKPDLNGIQLDVILEDVFESSVDVTGYTIESGARAADHRISKPRQWRITGGVSSHSLTSPSINPSRPSDTLAQLMQLMDDGDPFDIDAGDIQLSNMIITELSRVKDPINETGLIFTAQLTEFRTIDTLLNNVDNSIRQNSVNPSDPVATQGTGFVDSGTLPTSDASPSTVNTVLGIL